MIADEVYTILLVEDEATDALLFEMALRRHKEHFRICRVSEGTAGREWLGGPRACRDRLQFPFPDVVLLDLTLPDIHGFELLAWIRQQRHLDHLPVGILTGSVNEADLDRSAELGADFYLRKDTDLEHVAEALLRLLETGTIEPQFGTGSTTEQERRLPHLVAF